ncbi:hypothetical protein WJX81_006261 [Elliptochloris bilobata]|uniref:Uncharacterized protein n=1 Tax=Elliptochloris bilobata TaxID=381761 RepID=A0AAW1QJ30_9CHLO
MYIQAPLPITDDESPRKVFQDFHKKPWYVWLIVTVCCAVFGLVVIFVARGFHGWRRRWRLAAAAASTAIDPEKGATGPDVLAAAAKAPAAATLPAQTLPVGNEESQRAEKERRMGTGVPGAAAAKLRRVHSDAV